MTNATSVLTVENKKEIAKKIGTLNKIQAALAQNPTLTLDQMLLNTQITPEARAAYEKLMVQARCLIAGTTRYPTAGKDDLFRVLAQQDCFKSYVDLLLLSYALELRLNGFRPITPAVQKEAETRFVTYCDAPNILAETPVNTVFEPEGTPPPVAVTLVGQPVQPVAPVQPQPTQPVSTMDTATPDVSESLSNNMERDVLKRELMTKTRALIKLNETNRVMEMDGHKVPSPILNPYFDAEGHLNIGFTDLTNNVYLLDDLKIHRNQSELLSDSEKETLVGDWEDKYKQMGSPLMQPEGFAALDGFKEYSVPPDNASQVADLQINDDLDDLMQDLEAADISMIPFPLLQVALDIIYETGYALTETNPAFYQALLSGHYETLTDEDFIPRLDDKVWNNVARAKRRRVLIQMGMQILQKNNARPMGGAGKVAQTPENITQNQPVDYQKQ